MCEQVKARRGASRAGRSSQNVIGFAVLSAWISIARIRSAGFCPARMRVPVLHDIVTRCRRRGPPRRHRRRQPATASSHTREFNSRIHGLCGFLTFFLLRYIISIARIRSAGFCPARMRVPVLHDSVTRCTFTSAVLDSIDKTREELFLAIYSLSTRNTCPARTLHTCSHQTAL